MAVAELVLNEILDGGRSVLDSATAPILARLHHLLAAIPSLPFDRILAAVLVFLIFFLLRRPVRHILFLLVGRFFGIGQQDFREKLRVALKGPIELLPVIAGLFFAFQMLKPDESGTVDTISRHVIESLLIIAGYWALLALVDPLIEHLRPRTSKLTDSVVDWLNRALKCFVVFFAVAALLEQWGIRIGPLLAGMGIAGAAVALGAQALFKDLISGVLILLERRFQYGDWVQVTGVVEGTVESIGFRSTKIRQFNDAAVQVPNSKLADNAVINYAQMRRRRISWIIGVPYSTTVEQLKTIRNGIEAYIHDNDDFVSYKTASTFVRIDDFGSSSINIMVYCFTRTTKWGDWLAAKERLAYAIMKIVLDAGSSFAFPSTSLYVESLPQDRPDLFLPPEEGRPRIEPAPAGKPDPNAAGKPP